MLKLDYNILFNMLNIFILFLLMRHFLFGPVTAIMEKRKNAIEASFADAERTSDEAYKLKQEYEDTLTSIGEKADGIIKEAKQRALDEQDRQFKATKEEVAKMIQEANRTIELERKKSMQGIQSEVANIAMLAAAKVIQKNVDGGMNRQLVDDFLNEAGAVK